MTLISVFCYPPKGARQPSHHLLLEADEPPVADDYVIEKVDAEELGGLGKTSRLSPQ